MDDDEDDIVGGIYENGRWLWDERAKKIAFLSNLRPKQDSDMFTSTAPDGVFEFRDDVDIIEQMRYRRHFQRKLEPGQADIITVQDVKDVVLYTAPINCLSLKLINILHTPTGERFLRALILYCAYSLQVTDVMTLRNLELELKVRTPLSDHLENEYQDNLSDLRFLVAKEYCTMLVGAGDMKPFHHMGPLKKRRSLLVKDARSFETFIRISVQIVYLSLGRRYLKQIESETHRLLKSETFNAIERKAARGQIDHNKRPDNIQNVLMGKCLRHDRSLMTHSPLMNEVFCLRPIDYRLRGLGVVKYPNLTSRLRYLYLAVAGPEEEMVAENIIVGIIGMPRGRFDPMLRPLPQNPTPDVKSKSILSTQPSSKSTASMKKSRSGMRFFQDIAIPSKESVETVKPKDFEEEPEDVHPVNEVQRRVWVNRLKSMMCLLTQRRR